MAKKLAKALVQADKGIPFTPETLVVARYLTDWLESTRPTIRPKTYYSYAQLVSVHIMPGLGKVRLARLQKTDIERFLREREQAGSSPRTRQYLLSILRMSLERAVEGELIARNVAKLVKPPRVEQHEITPLDRDAVSRLLEAADGHRFQWLFQFLLGTGLRLGEALALRWSDVDPEHTSITVRHTLERIPGQPWRITEPKSASGRRVVPLVAPAVASLRAQRKGGAALQLRASDWQDLNLVFPNVDGNPLDGTNVLHELKKLLSKAGLPTTTRVHDLRHGAATYLLAAGVNPRIVMQIMGWSQISMLKRYQHVVDDMLRDAAIQLDNHLTAKGIFGQTATPL